MGYLSILDLWYNETKKFSKKFPYLYRNLQSKIKTLQNIFENPHNLDISYSYKGSIIL